MVNRDTSLHEVVLLHMRPKRNHCPAVSQTVSGISQAPLRLAADRCGIAWTVRLVRDPSGGETIHSLWLIWQAIETPCNDVTDERRSSSCMTSSFVYGKLSNATKVICGLTQHYDIADLDLISSILDWQSVVANHEWAYSRHAGISARSGHAAGS